MGPQNPELSQPGGIRISLMEVLMPRFSIFLDSARFDELLARARAERRNVRDQAAILLERTLATLPPTNAIEATREPAPTGRTDAALAR